jgi:hypothetical protein
MGRSNGVESECVKSSAGRVSAWSERGGKDDGDTRHRQGGGGGGGRGTEKSSRIDASDDGSWTDRPASARCATGLVLLGAESKSAAQATPHPSP